MACEQDSPPPSKEWLLWEEIILSDQMSAAQIQALMTSEPEFAVWLQRRAGQRQRDRKR